MLINYDDTCRQRRKLVNNMSITVEQDIHILTGNDCEKDINSLSTVKFSGY
jgi:hypothetical protein